ncbi:hypothetical protein PR048_001734 [Dryococelus australis]|uniref:Uncharacterized protein n=1 Tax=Dryococelus australis TaxID=614101 RepID=A0ABQ9II65_9NEOP|nr:hypothetical protein PR048_001734 [Dryococelus australis]
MLFITLEPTLGRRGTGTSSPFTLLLGSPVALLAILRLDSFPVKVHSAGDMRQTDLPHATQTRPLKMAWPVRAPVYVEAGSFAVSTVMPRLDSPGLVYLHHPLRECHTPHWVLDGMLGRGTILPSWCPGAISTLLRVRIIGRLWSPGTSSLYLYSFGSILRRCSIVPGILWLNNFLHSHSELAVRTPHAVSLARVKNFTREKTDMFFQLLKLKLQLINHDHSRIYNVDETSITVVQERVPNISESRQ